MRTLIAEDDAPSRIALQAILNKWGHDVLIAQDGYQTWEAMRRADPPMLIILDWMMPGMDGLEVCRRVRTLHLENPPYIIMLSGKSQKQDIIKALEVGANDYLTKPVDFDELRARIGVGKRMMELQGALVQKSRESWDARERLERIFAALDDAIFVIDAQSLTIRDCNLSACAIFDYARADMLGQTTAFLHASQASYGEFEACLRILMENKEAQPSLPEFTMRRSNGLLFPAEHSVTTLVDELSRQVGWVILIRDVSRHREAEMREKIQQKQLFQAAKMAALGTLVAGVAHEVNNPNNFIMLNAPLLEQVWYDALPVLERHHADHPDFELTGIPFEQVRDYARELFSGIHEGSKRIKHIVAELKHFVRQTPLDLTQEVQLNEVVAAALTILRKTIIQHTSQFSQRLDPNLPLVRGDFQKLEQVVINLLINACQALTDRDRAIVLETLHDPAQEEVVLRIIDNGEGIPEENLGRILDPFFSTRQNIGGTGLGLAISAVVIRDHAGRIAFDSTPGGGTTVTVSLKAVA